ncbi:MAG: hypothetical protein MHM6MM_005522 [Cercozoa sp. M6MM]
MKLILASLLGTAAAAATDYANLGSGSTWNPYTTSAPSNPYAASSTSPPTPSPSGGGYVPPSSGYPDGKDKSIPTASLEDLTRLLSAPSAGEGCASSMQQAFKSGVPELAPKMCSHVVSYPSVTLGRLLAKGSDFKGTFCGLANSIEKIVSLVKELPDGEEEEEEEVKLCKTVAAGYRTPLPKGAKLLNAKLRFLVSASKKRGKGGNAPELPEKLIVKHACVDDKDLKHVFDLKANLFDFFRGIFDTEQPSTEDLAKASNCGAWNKIGGILDSGKLGMFHLKRKSENTTVWLQHIDVTRMLADEAAIHMHMGGAPMNTGYGGAASNYGDSYGQSNGGYGQSSGSWHMPNNGYNTGGSWYGGSSNNGYNTGGGWYGGSNNDYNTGGGWYGGSNNGYNTGGSMGYGNGYDTSSMGGGYDSGGFSYSSDHSSNYGSSMYAAHFGNMYGDSSAYGSGSSHGGSSHGGSAYGDSSSGYGDSGDGYGGSNNNGYGGSNNHGYGNTNNGYGNNNNGYGINNGYGANNGYGSSGGFSYGFNGGYGNTMPRRDGWHFNKMCFFDLGVVNKDDDRKSPLHVTVSPSELVLTLGRPMTASKYNFHYGDSYGQSNGGYGQSSGNWYMPNNGYNTGGSWYGGSNNGYNTGGTWYGGNNDSGNWYGGSNNGYNTGGSWYGGSSDNGHNTGGSWYGGNNNGYNTGGASHGGSSHGGTGGHTPVYGTPSQH